MMAGIIKLQIKINSILHQGMLNICKLNDWNPKDAYESAIVGFLANYGMKYHKLLKKYVLDVPDLKTVETIIGKVKDNGINKETSKGNRSKEGNNKTTNRQRSKEA